MVLDGLADHVLEGGLEVLRPLQPVGVDPQALGHSGVEHNVGAGDGVGGAHHAELKLIAREGEGGGTVAVAVIPFLNLAEHLCIVRGHPPGSQLGTAAACPFFGGGGQENLDLCLGKHHCPDVASIHYHVMLHRHILLERKQKGADCRKCAHMAGCRRDFRTPNVFRDIVPVQEYPLLPLEITQLQLDPAQHWLHRCFRINVHFVRSHIKCDCPVERPCVDIKITQFVRQLACNCAFSGSRRPINRDCDHIHSPI